MRRDVEARVVAGEDHLVGELPREGGAELGRGAKDVADLASAEQRGVLCVVVVSEVELRQDSAHFIFLRKGNKLTPNELFSKFIS